MVNQVLCHISNSPLELIDYCQKKGIVMEAYSPVAHGEALKIPAIAEMAKKYGVSVPQLCVRYDIQFGMIVLPIWREIERLFRKTWFRGGVDKNGIKNCTDSRKRFSWRVRARVCAF